MPPDAGSPPVEPEPEPVAVPVEALPVEAEPEPEPLPPGPVRTDETAEAHARAQERLLRGDHLPLLFPVPSKDESTAEGEPVEETAEGSAAEGEPEAEAEPAAMPGYFVPITDPDSGPALAHFHAAIRALVEGRDPDGKVRVAMYGASGTAADLGVGYIRTYLQTRFGDGGPGFVPLAPLSRWYRHNEVKVDASKGWKKEHAQVRSGRLDGHYGLLGASFTATEKKRWSTVEPKKKSTSSQGLAQVELYFLRQPGGGSFRFSLDDGPAVVVSTDGEELGPGYHALQVEPGPHRLRVETLDEAEVRVFGVVLERNDPGVVVDVLGIDGTRGPNHLSWNETLWADNLARRAPDLYTLSYGTNESVDEEMSIPLYAEDLRAQLHRFQRALPEASCLIIGPVDFPIREDGVLRSRTQLNEIIEVQRKIAAEEGCGFWDGVAFMGGEFSMETWVNADPPLARGDYLHFNARGAARKGMALADALMYGFDARAMRAGG